MHKVLDIENIFYISYVLRHGTLETCQQGIIPQALYRLKNYDIETVR